MLRRTRGGRNLLILLVPGTGIEPVQHFCRGILSPLLGYFIPRYSIYIIDIYSYNILRFGCPAVAQMPF